jgi:hypothetical protein
MKLKPTPCNSCAQESREERKKIDHQSQTRALFSTRITVTWRRQTR